MLKVDWSKVKKLSNNTRDNLIEFEEARMNYQSIIKSLDECWIGKDKDSFFNNCDAFLEELKNDSIYLENLYVYFGKSSDKYMGVVEDYNKKIESINNKIEKENEKFNEIIG